MSSLGLRPTIRQLLADGSWYSFLDIYAYVQHLITEHAALRRYATLRRSYRPHDQQVIFGKQEILRNALYLMRLERDGARGAPLELHRYRLRQKTYADTTNTH
jgi:hypothetical protein